jgi:hypothetical protein
MLSAMDMKLDTPLVTLFEYPIAELINRLPSRKEDVWDVNAKRQRMFEVHHDTRSIVFRWLDNSWIPGNRIRVEEYDYAPKPLIDAVNEYASTLAVHFSGKVVKLMLAELKPGGAINSHKDKAPALCLSHRCHLPLLTNAHVTFSVSGVAYNLREGTVFEFDNTRDHFVKNESILRRVHLICDVMPMKYSLERE